jgi:hypothetical protein
LGIYILEDAFANPVAAQAAAVITAAFSIALGAILLFYLVKPRRSYKSTYVEAAGDLSFERATIQTKVPPAPRKKARSDLAPRWVYVDPARIPPRPRF